MAKKKSLVDEICDAPKVGGWFARLSSEDQKTALEVRSRVQKESLQANAVARKMVEALKIKNNYRQIAEWLKKKEAK